MKLHTESSGHCSVFVCLAVRAFIVQVGQKMDCPKNGLFSGVDITLQWLMVERRVMSNVSEICLEKV